MKPQTGVPAVQMSIQVMSAHAAAVIVVVGTPSMIREGWAIAVATRRSVAATEATEHWTPAEIRCAVNIPNPVGQDVGAAIGAALAYAAAFDVVALARSLEELGLLR